MRAIAVVPPALFGAGLLLVTVGAEAGSSGAGRYPGWVGPVEVIAGAVLLLAAFVTLPRLLKGPFRVASEGEGIESLPTSTSEAGEEGPVAVLVIGPTPVLVGVGRWANTRVRRMTALGGGVFALALVLVVLGF